MHILQTSIQANPNVGLYIYATDEFAILGPEAKSIKEEVEEVLGVPAHIISIAGTSLAGVFLAGNSKHLLVPPIVFEHELELLKQLPVEVHVFETIHTALGNNLVINDHGIVAGPMFSKQEQQQLHELLELPVHQIPIADIEVVGSSVVHSTKGGVIHRDARQAEIDLVADTLKLPQLIPGTANFGQPYVRSAIAANTHGFVIGASSGGPEVTNTDEALGFLDN